MATIDRFEYGAIDNTYYGSYTIKLGELIIDAPLDFSDELWDFDSFDDEQRDRFWKKFQYRYWYHELGIMPFKRWHMELMRIIDERMPVYKMLYQALADGVSIMEIGDTYHKSRHIYSDFPQTMLGGQNQDYASAGNDTESETLQTGNFLDIAAKVKYYDDVDAMLLDDVRPVFSCLSTVSFNGF